MPAEIVVHVLRSMYGDRQAGLVHLMWASTSLCLIVHWVILGLYWDTGKGNGNHHNGFRVQGGGFGAERAVRDLKLDKLITSQTWWVVLFTRTGTRF